MNISIAWISFALSAVAFPALSQTPPTAQQAREPSWPQTFAIQGPQVQSYAFPVTQPGPISISVQSQGAPLNVVLQGPPPNPVTQGGPGVLRINYTATAQDVQRGIFWQVKLSLAQPGRASGNVTVQHPPADQAKVQQALQALIAQRHIPTDQERAQSAAQTKMRRAADLAAYKAQIAQRRAQNHAANVARLQPMLSDMLRQKAALQSPAGSAPPPPSPAGTNQVTSRGLIPVHRPPYAPLAAPNITGYTVAHDQDQINLPAGSPPYGQPGDGVTITGTNFSIDDGEVHFVIGPNPGQDIVAPPGSFIWLNTQIFTPVPTVSGFLPFSGQIYIKRLTDGAKSNFVPFQFEPDLEQREISVPADYVLAQARGVEVSITNNAVIRTNDNFFGGATGVDQFFISTKLKNGWTVSQQPLITLGIGAVYQSEGYVGGQAFALPIATGTDTLSLSVYFSVGPAANGWFGLPVDGNVMAYQILIPIQGAAGVPDGVVCPLGTQCPAAQ
jgi:hypothetical protein